MLRLLITLFLFVSIAQATTNLTVNGVSYAYPETGDTEWGDDATNWASAITSGVLQKAGGSFELSSEVDFGSSFGVQSLYWRSRSADVAQSGEIRLGNSDTVTFRNSGNSADLELGMSGDNLQFNSKDLADVSSSQTLTNKTLTSPVLNTSVSGTAVLDEDDMASDSNTKLATQQSIKKYVDDSVSAKDTFVELSDTTSGYGSANQVVFTDGISTLSYMLVTDDNIDPSANIGVGKLAALAASRAIQTSSVGVLEASSVTNTELGYVSGVTSAIQDQIDAKQADVITTQGDLVVGDVGGSASVVPIGSDGQLFTSNGTTASWQNAPVGADGETVMAVNYFQDNSGFEAGDLTNWTNSGATASAQAIEVGEGSYSLSWDASAASQSISSDSWTIPAGLKNNNVVFCFAYKGGDENINFTVTGTSGVILEETLEASTNWSNKCYNRIMPDVANLSISLDSTADAAVIYADSFSIGLASRVNITEKEVQGQCDLTVTGENSWSTVEAKGIPYQVFDESGSLVWRLRFNISGSVSSGSRSTQYVEISGITFKNTSNFYQSVDLNISASGAEGGQAIAVPNDDRINIGHATLTTTAYRLSGDVLLESEPTFSCDVKQTLITPEVTNNFASIRYAGDTGNSSAITASSWTTFSDADWTDDRTLIGKAEAPDTANDFGIKVSNLPSGKYMVVFNGTLYNEYISSATLCSYSIYDGTNRRGIQYNRTSSDTVQMFTNGVIGVFEYSAVGDRNFVIQGYRASGGGNCYLNFTAAERGAEISVIPLEPNIEQPQILNQVSSSADAGVRIVSASITNSGTPTVGTQDGTWISSITDNGTGQMRINIASGIFSSSPRCFITIRTGIIKYQGVVSSTNTSYADVETGDGSTNSNVDLDYFIMCIGAK